MTIDNDLSTQTVLGFRFIVKDESGKVLDRTYESEPVWFFKNSNEIPPQVENALMKLTVGEKASVEVDQPFGPKIEEKIIHVPRSVLPGDRLKVGDFFRVDPKHEPSKSSSPEHTAVPVYQLIGFTLEHAILDGNHPLAGKALTFDVELVEKRNATQDELNHGHPIF